MRQEKDTLGVLSLTQFCRGLVYPTELTTESISSNIPHYTPSDLHKGDTVLHCTFLCSECKSTTGGQLYGTRLV